MKQWLRALLLLLLIFAVGCGTRGCGTRRLTIQAIQLADGDGSNISPIAQAQVRTWVDTANDNYENISYEFVFDSTVSSSDFVEVRSTVLNTVPGTDEERQTYRIVGNFLALVFYPDRATVLFRARGGGGWSWGPSTTAFVSMPAYENTCISKQTPGVPCPGGCCQNDTLLSHELGHFLGLPHTFPAFGCEDDPMPCNPCNVIALANADGDAGGQDGSSAIGFLADDINDTNPDPRADCAPTTALSCPGGTVMVNGQTFDPPWTNLMGYHDCLPETISDDQRVIIGRTLTHKWRKQIVGD